ncbi:hypothetical protein A3860_28345 [Niastella vici]|uniref:GYF domain-containing protein n=1 Tax=Niastella vici TaxID=1703345 RepID=A0A1V9FW79_9BACT|nr:DUF4339 domain-containing protein [Niastella vici]OQP62603.1 hypothetical protein A3860_28345 [Niastella vici]
MNTYLLLRDNKQTGPYTAQQLAEKGLKPYDLVWHEGRSAAWRYPSEIEELKAFAPVVEEQPYDRFYKKPGEQAAEQSSATVQTQTVQETQPVNKQAEQKAAKHIYVTMPGGKAVANTTTPVAKKEETVKPVAQQNDWNANSASAKNTEKKAAAGSYIISEEDDELNSGMLKGYQSRKKEDDEINNSYMSDYESRKAAYVNKKSGSSTGSTGSTIKQPAEKPVVAAVKEKESWSTPARKKNQGVDLKALLAGSGKYLQDNKNLTRALVAAVLILGGVVIGLVINAGHRQPDTKALESLVKEIREQQNEKASTTGAATETVQKNNEPQEEAPGRNDNANNAIAEQPPVTTPVHNNPATQKVQHAVIKKENNIVPPPQQQPQQRSISVTVANTTPQPVEAAPAVIKTEEKAINQEVLEKARKNIYEQVHVEASAFKTGLFGGISDLDITLQNKSLYPLDQVAVEIKYFGPEKKLVKTQTIIFNNVPPGKRRTLDVPSTNRGIAIDYSITSINSKALGLAQAGF